MAQKIRIAELEIDDKALIASTAELKKNIDAIKASQKELSKSTDDTSKEYVKNAADLKILNSAYNSNVKALSERTKATVDATVREELMTTVLNTEIKTIKQARDQNKILNKIRNETNVTTEQGQKELKALNDALDSNNEFIKENADQYLQQKINIGNYKDSITEAFQELNIFNGGLGGFITRSKEAGGVGNLLKSSLGAAAQGFVGLTKASLAFILTPVGAVIAALVAAFALIKNAMDRSEESTNKLKLAFAAVTGVFNTVLKALEPLGEFLIDGLVMGFELAVKAAENAIAIISDGLSYLGFESASESINEWTDAIKEGVKAAVDLEKAEQDLEKSQRKARLTQLEYQKDAEKLRQIRDDENLTLQERVKANEDLGKVLEQQLKDELLIAEQALLVANLRIEAEGQTSVALDAQAEALTEIADIQERLTGQESEQLTNRVALQKEAADKAKEYGEQAIQQQELLLETYIAAQGTRAKTLEEEVKQAQVIANKEIEILEAKLKNRNLTQQEYDLELLEIQNDLAAKQAELVVDNAQRELDEYVKLNQSKLDNETFFSDESLRIEQERLDALAEKQRVFAALQLEQGVINQQEYNDAINTVNEENRVANEEAQKVRDEAQKAADVVDLENKRAIDEEKRANDFELKYERLEEDKQQELEAAELLGADKQLIEDKYAAKEIALDKEVQQSKLTSAADVFGQTSQLLGEESELGKLAAIAQSTINVSQGVTKAIAQGGLAGIATGAIVAAKGAISIKQIASTPTFESGGIQEIGGKRHSAGGTKFYGEDGTVFEAERGEGIGVLNRAAFAGFMDFNNSYLGGSSNNGKFAGGGIITQAVRPTNGATDLTELQRSIANMRVQVAVEDINTGQGNYAEVVNGANV